MSDDRMDRAERIRRMNEGRASDDEPDTAETGDDAAERRADDGDARAAEADDAPDAAAGSDTEADGVEDAPDSSPDDEATATALRAARASASVDGGVDVGEGSPAEASSVATTATGDGATASDETDGAVSAEDDVAPVDGPTGAGAAAGAETPAGTATEETVRVLEFVVGDQAFCLDIAAVEEIVEHESVTRVPNAPECVSGVVDLRGQITTILDPRTFLDARGGADPSLIVVFDPVAFESQGAVGWLVDEVSRVASVPESAVTDAPGDDDHVKGVLDREDEDDLIVWIDPHAALDLVTGDVASADG